jgi:hypothetical protein
MCSGGRWLLIFRVARGQERKSGLASPIGSQGLAEEIKHGTLLLATGFDNEENALDKRLSRSN